MKGVSSKLTTYILIAMALGI
ncbi:MAG: hypothetical protein RLZZ333_678, partial [Bacteroidota bacterium]